MPLQRLVIVTQLEFEPGEGSGPLSHGLAGRKEMLSDIHSVPGRAKPSEGVWGFKCDFARPSLGSSDGRKKAG